MSKPEKFKLFHPYSIENYKEIKSEYENKRPKDHEVKVNSDHIKEDFKRNAWVKISYGKNKIYRVIKGSNVSNLKNNFGWLDYDSKLELKINNGDEKTAVIQINEANFIERWFLAPLKHPNPMERSQFCLSMVIAVFALLITLFSLI